jgi:hypothetical protein
MSTLRIYGDSFASQQYGGNNHAKEIVSWMERTGHFLNMPIVNSAVAGSSLSYSMRILVEDVSSNTLVDGDVVIFVMTNAGRLHFNLQLMYPETSCYFWNNIESYQGEAGDWFIKNRKHLEFFITNRDMHIDIIDYYSYMHTIKSLAQTYTKSKFLVIQTYPQESKPPITLPMGDRPSNFLCPDFFLGRVSESEIINFKSYDSWVEHTGYDIRFNHLSKINTQIFANMIFYALKNLDAFIFNYDDFRKDILKPLATKQQYKEYVDLGFLFDSFKAGFSSNIEERLK